MWASLGKAGKLLAAELSLARLATRILIWRRLAAELDKASQGWRREILIWKLLAAELGLARLATRILIWRLSAAQLGKSGQVWASGWRREILIYKLLAAKLGNSG